MAIIALRAWHLDGYEPIAELDQRPHDLRLSKKSLLKSGLRADFLDDATDVKASPWFRQYLEGERVEFYIEGSGGYAIANIDLISQEIYFTKRDIASYLEPTIVVSEGAGDMDWGAIAEDYLASITKELRVPVTVMRSPRLSDQTHRLTQTLTRQIRQCLVFVADTTALTQAGADPALLVPSPQVVLELGYAMAVKPADQVLVLDGTAGAIAGTYPFDLPSYQLARFPKGEDPAARFGQALGDRLQQLRVLK
ncbi:MAG: hypothetical protein AAGF75_09780 [Cyanobacteria bacterium P01_H01_bin.130]